MPFYQLANPIHSVCFLEQKCYAMLPTSAEHMQELKAQKSALRCSLNATSDATQITSICNLAAH